MTIDQIETRVLRRVLAPGPLTLRLFEMVNGEVREIAGGGYQPVTLDANAWQVEGGEGIGPVQEFRFNGRARHTIAGAALTDGNGGVVSIKQFKEPIAVGRNGDIVPVRPTIKIASLL